MNTIIVDDTDLSHLTYKGNWVKEGTSPEYNSTTHGTGTEGSTATFTFEGTSVSVYGSISLSPPSGKKTVISTYKLDDSSVATFSAPVTSVDLQHQLFFQSPELQDGRHTLIITVTTANPTSRYWLDYLTYDSTSAASATSTSLPLHSPSSAHTSPSSAAGNSSGSSANHAGIIAAAVIVPLFILVLGILSFFCWRRHKKRPMRARVLIDDEVPAPVLPGPETEMSAVSPYMSHVAPPSYADSISSFNLNSTTHLIEPSTLPEKSRASPSG